MMKRVGLVCQPKADRSGQLAQEVERHLHSVGVTSWRADVGDSEALLRETPGSDLVVTLGGDGTIVAVAHQTAHLGVPILGVNLGRLGFLTELEPDQALPGISSVLQGRYWVEERMMLHAELRRDGHLTQRHEALNDVVASRGRVARVVRIEAYIDGQYLTTYYGDGVVAATPTGSTAYSLAAGGPVLEPQLRNIVLTPIAAHLTVAQSLVLPSDASVRLIVRTGYEASLTVDGQDGAELADGDEVHVTASEVTCRFIRMGERTYFYRTLLEKLR
jgi:NAD+ kinase